MRDGVRQPFLFLLSDHTGEPGSTQILADVHSIYDRLPSGRRRLSVIPGANHFAFSDDGALLKSGVFRLFLRALGKLRIDSRRQLAITREELHRFFDAQLPSTASREVTHHGRREAELPTSMPHRVIPRRRA